MALKSVYPFSFLLYVAIVLLFLVGGNVQARESQFFSKVTMLDSTNNVEKTKTTQAEPAKAPEAAAGKNIHEKDEDDDPVFIPQTGHNGYGLYGHDDESTTTPAKTSSEHYTYNTEKADQSDEVKFYRNYYSGTDDDHHQNSMLYGKTINPATNSKGYHGYPGSSSASVDRSTNNNPQNYNYYSYNNNGLGLSDTRYDLQHGKYYYYANSDKSAAVMNSAMGAGNPQYSNYLYNHNNGADAAERFNRYRQRYNSNNYDRMQTAGQGVQFNDEFTFNP